MTEMHHYVYKIQIGSRFYIGVRSSKTSPEKDPYKGSGNCVLYGICFAKKTKTVVSEHKTRRDAEVEESRLIRENFGSAQCLNLRRSNPKKSAHV